MGEVSSCRDSPLLWGQVAGVHPSEGPVQPPHLAGVSPQVLSPAQAVFT